MKKTSLFQKAVSIVLLVLTVSISAFASPTALSTQVLPQNNTQINAGGLTLTLTACDNTNGNSFTATGREILIVQNTDTSSHTFTITPVTDPYGGTNTTLTNYSAPASSFSALQMKYLVGWANAGVVGLTCSSNLIKYAVIQYN